MTKPRNHPGLTGVIKPVHFNIPKDKRREIQQLDVVKELDSFDDEPFFDGLEAACSFYLGAKPLAEQSSAGKVRANLATAYRAADKLAKALNALDGNSRMLVNSFAKGKAVFADAENILCALMIAKADANTRFPQKGRRRYDEKVFLAAQVAELLKSHSSARLSMTEGKIFEEMLRQVFGLLGESCDDLHSLARKALRPGIITRDNGVTIFQAPK